MSDWSIIQQEYERGDFTSLQVLADKHGVSKTTLIRRRDIGQWTTDRSSGPRTGPPTPPTSGPVHLPIPADGLSIARIGLQQLAQHLQGHTTEETLSISSHKSLSDALAQYVKVLAMAPQESQDGFVILFEELLPQTVDVIRQALVEDERLQRTRSEEGAS